MYLFSSHGFNSFGKKKKEKKKEGGVLVGSGILLFSIEC